MRGVLDSSQLIRLIHLVKNAGGIHVLTIVAARKLLKNPVIGLRLGRSLWSITWSGREGQNARIAITNTTSGAVCKYEVGTGCMVRTKLILGATLRIRKPVNIASSNAPESANTANTHPRPASIPLRNRSCSEAFSKHQGVGSAVTNGQLTK